MAAADLVEEVLAPAEQLERLTDLLLRKLRLAGAEVDLGERRDGLRRIGVVPEVERDLECLFQLLDRLLGLAEQEVEHAEVVGEAADEDLVAQQLVRGTRLLRIRAREHPVALPVGDDRRLEVRLADGARVLHRFRELERALDVLARGLVVALMAPAARAPGEDRRPERVAREARAFRERERLVEEADRGLDAGEMEPADRQREQHLRALDVGELSAFRQPARAIEEIERRPQLALAHLHLREPGQDANLELRRRGRVDCGEEGVEVGARLVVVAGLEQGLGAGDGAFEAATLVGRDAVGQETAVDAEPRGEPVDRLARGTGLAALDLAHVLLREAVAGEIALRQPGRDAQLAQALAEPERLGGRCGAGLGREIAAHRAAGSVVNLTLHKSATSSLRPSPKKGMSMRNPESSEPGQNHLTELLDGIGHRSYSEATLQPGRTPGSGLQGARRRSGATRKVWLGRRVTPSRFRGSGEPH